jgi:hypothetical protein
VNWHWPLAAIVAPASAMPVGAVVVSVPPQIEVDAVGTVRPLGKVSVNATPVSATVVFGLVSVKVSEVVPLSAIVAAPNALLMLGGAATVRLALAVLPVPPSFELTALVVLV